ncbi:MAG TPA: polysaccharide biosynthesis tyrosine autokinase, partial [Blastocatellia bacterium]|nr:polysaccharide biosynthesis tyrosine autokinase [Blastocatellia bacterium]
MSDNRQNVELAPMASSPMYYPGSYPDPPQYGGSPKGEAKLAMLREWRRIIYRHKWLILSIVVAVLPLATIQAYRAKPVYQATTTIEIRSEGSSLAKAGTLVYVDSSESTKSEMLIIKSQPVMKKTVSDLDLDKNPRFLEVNTKRSVLQAITSLVKGNAHENSSKTGANAGELKTAGIESYDSPMLSEQAERKRLAPYIQTLSDNLSVTPERDTRLLRISFRHTDPEIATAVANGVAYSFRDYSFDTKTERFNSASNWLEESTRRLRAQVERAEQKLVNYSKENNIVTVDGKENLVADKLTKLHDQVTRAQYDLILKKSLYEEVKQGRVAQLPEAFADPGDTEVRKELNALAVEASQLSVKFGAKNPKVQEVQKRMATLQEQLKGNQGRLEDKLKADYERATREEADLKAELERVKGEAVQQNQASIQYSVLQQDLETAKALYQDFLNKTSQAGIQRAEQFNNVRIIEEAESSSPAGPNRSQTIIIALVVSLALGVGLAYLIENLNTTIRTVEDVSRLTQLPLLAVIPSLNDALPQGRRNGAQGNGIRSIEIKGGQSKELNDSYKSLGDFSDKPVLVDSMKMFSAAAEAYRMLRTSILLSTAGRPPKTMMVTSSQPGDGKTTTIFNIALALTQLKAEVVIVDCDMRKPRIHKLLQLTKGEGLSTLLSSGGDLNRFISRTSVPHLSAIPCGHVPPNPSELISSESMKELLRSLGERFDYVLIDSPPLFTVSDPIILSTLVDGVILVVKSGQSKSELVRRACQDLASVGARILGVTLNNLNLRKDGYDYYNSYRQYVD